MALAGNVFVERLWRNLKYEEVYLHVYETVRDAQEGVVRYMTFYSSGTPDRIQRTEQPLRLNDVSHTLEGPRRFYE